MNAEEINRFRIKARLFAANYSTKYISIIGSNRPTKSEAKKIVDDCFKCFPELKKFYKYVNKELKKK